MDYEQTIIIVVAVFSAFILFLLYRRYELSVKTRMLRIEYQNKLLDKFGTSKEFVDFLKSDQSKKVLEDPGIIGQPNPMRRVLRGVQIGLINIIVGFGLLINAWMMGSPTDPNDINKQKDYLFLARQLVMIGAAFFAVSGASHVLAKRWGLASPKNRPMNE